MSYAARLTEVADRRARLIAKCARQREQLAGDLSAWQGPIGAIDRGVRAARLLRTHPVLLVAIALTVAVFGRRHLVRWAGRGLFAWKIWNTVRTSLRAAGA